MQDLLVAVCTYWYRRRVGGWHNAVRRDLMVDFGTLREVRESATAWVAVIRSTLPSLTSKVAKKIAFIMAVRE